jgi:hypothetical protein
LIGAVSRLRKIELGDCHEVASDRGRVEDEQAEAPEFAKAAAQERE